MDIIITIIGLISTLFGLAFSLFFLSGFVSGEWGFTSKDLVYTIVPLLGGLYCFIVGILLSRKKTSNQILKITAIILSVGLILLYLCLKLPDILYGF